MMANFIALEEHFLADVFLESDTQRRWTPSPFDPALRDTGEGRLQAMSAGNIAFQVLSHAPLRHLPTHRECEEANGQLHAIVRARPDKYGAFALLPMHDPHVATTMLCHFVTERGFLGALVPNSLPNGSFYDDPCYWELFAEAERLDVPVYLHPAFPSPIMTARSQGAYSDITAMHLATTAWQCHSDTGLHLIRLFASGLFERHPRLKIVNRTHGRNDSVHTGENRRRVTGMELPHQELRAGVERECMGDDEWPVWHGSV